MKTIRKHDTGAAVKDVQQRLRILGYELSVDGVFGERTEAAILTFRKKEGLPSVACIDASAWSALVDATFALGDRMLYLRMPYFHGKDVQKLQAVLNALGFFPGKEDGIFGAHTEYALRDFQSSVGLAVDGVLGVSTVEAIQRLHHAWEGKQSVSTDISAHMGFARAAEALENLEACFFGIDDLGRRVATRIANLAQATTPDACVASAERLTEIPPETMIMVGVGSNRCMHDHDKPLVSYSIDGSFPKRLYTALAAMPESRRRVFIGLDGSIEISGQVVEGERLEQHLAVAILDSFCDAYSNL